MQTVEKKSNPTTQFPVQFCQKNINLDLILFENKWCWYYCYKNWTKIEKYSRVQKSIEKLVFM